MMTHPTRFIKTFLLSNNSKLLLSCEHDFLNEEYLVKSRGVWVVDGVEKFTSESDFHPLDNLDQAERELREKMLKELSFVDWNVRKVIDTINGLQVFENNYRGAFETFALRLNREVPDFKQDNSGYMLNSAYDLSIELEVAGVTFLSRSEVVGSRITDARQKVCRTVLKEIFDTYGFEFS